MSAVLKARERSAQYVNPQAPAVVGQFELLAGSPDGVTQLRALIVSLATSGRLNPQNAAQEALSVNGRQEDGTRLELPHGWRWITLEALGAEFQNGASSRGDAGGRPITVLRLADIKGRRVSLANTRQVCIHERHIEKYRVHDGDILITRVNGSADIVGRFNLVEGDIGAIYCDHFVRMRIARDFVYPKYLALFGESEFIRNRISNLFISTAGQKTVNQGHIGSLPIALPPLVEQTRIVARVDELMHLCDALEATGRLEAEQHARLLTTLLGTMTDSRSPEELAANWHRVAAHIDLLLARPEALDKFEQAILLLAVQGRVELPIPSEGSGHELLETIRADKVAGREARAKSSQLEQGIAESKEYLCTIPTHWAWCLLGDLATQGPSNGLSPRPVDSPTPIRCLSLSATTQGYFKTDCFKYVDVPSHVAKPFLLKRWDLLIQRGNSLDHVGIPAVYDGEDDAYIFPDLMMRIQLSPQVDVHFVHMWLLSDYARDHFRRNATGTQGTMPKINQALVRSAPVPLPPLSEQRRIVARVTELRRLCADLRQRLTAQQATQARLAQALVESATA